MKRILFTIAVLFALSSPIAVFADTSHHQSPCVSSQQASLTGQFTGQLADGGFCVSCIG